MTRRPGTESSRGSIGCFPSNPRAPFLCPSSSSITFSSSSSCSCSSFTSSSSTTYVLGRASLVAPRRPSYSFVRPNFYERLPARESRNCLFSGTPGTSSLLSVPTEASGDRVEWLPSTLLPVSRLLSLSPFLWFLQLTGETLSPPTRPPSRASFYFRNRGTRKTALLRERTLYLV